MSATFHRTGRTVSFWMGDMDREESFTFATVDLAERFYSAISGDQSEQAPLQIAAENLVTVWDDPDSGEDSFLAETAVELIRVVLNTMEG